MAMGLDQVFLQVYNLREIGIQLLEMWILGILLNKCRLLIQYGTCMMSGVLNIFI